MIGRVDGAANQDDHAAGDVGQHLRRGHARQRRRRGRARSTATDGCAPAISASTSRASIRAPSWRCKDVAGGEPAVAVPGQLARQRFLAEGVPARRVGADGARLHRCAGQGALVQVRGHAGSADRPQADAACRRTTTSRCSRTSARRSRASSIRSTAGTSDLLKLTAEYAPSTFSPSTFSPSTFSPSTFSPDAYSPSTFSPSTFSPSVFSPSTFSPSTFSPSTFSPVDASARRRSARRRSARRRSARRRSRRPSTARRRSRRRSRPRRREASSPSPPPPGLSDEATVVNTWNRTGYFYVRVTGRGGAFDTSTPFTLSVTKGVTTCAGVTDTVLTPRPAVAASGLKTVHPHRLVEGRARRRAAGPGGGTLRSKLAAFAARSRDQGRGRRRRRRCAGQRAEAAGGEQPGVPVREEPRRRRDQGHRRCVPGQSAAVRRASSATTTRFRSSVRPTRARSARNRATCRRCRATRRPRRACAATSC